MQVLSVIHGDEARAELFAPVVEEAGHRLDEWSFAWGTPPPRPLDSYDAVLVFGGAMHADQDDTHPWLAPETAWLEQLLARKTPVLGVCLGVQLLARAAGAWVGAMPEPEIGWHDVELTDAGVDDPVVGALPPRSTRSSGTTTRTACRPAPSSSRAALPARRRSASATRAGACSSIPR